MTGGRCTSAAKSIASTALPAGHLVVSDYKTGRQSGLADLTKDPVAAGTLLQLPLYGLAARARFGSERARTRPVLAAVE